jgi:hypothetical protein
MSGLDNLKTRVDYRGGKIQQDRMKQSKLTSLKRALLYSYQAGTAILEDGREFRCLINKDKTKISTDDKIISIPFEDVLLNGQELDENLVQKHKTSEGQQVIGMKPGDTFTWKDTNTHWLVYMQKLEETAYFRAEIRRCAYTFTIDGKTYKVFARKKDLGDIDWQTAKNTSWNNLDYSLEMYITRDDITQDYFKRFDIIKLNGLNWEVQAVDSMSVEGIVMIALKEYYSNTIEEQINLEKEENTPTQEPVDETIPVIIGDAVVYPYDEVEYTIMNAEGGSWSIRGTKAKILNQTDTAVIVAITTGKSGLFELAYSRENEDDIVLEVTIESL